MAAGTDVHASALQPHTGSHVGKDVVFRAMRRCDRPGVRLYVFPFAGAGPASLQEWTKALPAWVEPVGVVYPGREGRMREAPPCSLAELADSIAQALVLEQERPFAFFGHSMGAYLAYEVSVRLEGRASAPEALFLSGAGAPGAAPPDPIGSLPTREFLTRLIALNGFPTEVLQSAELISLALPILRSDFRICEAHIADGWKRHVGSVPVHAFAGRNDPRSTPDRVRDWRYTTTGAFQFHEFDGDHFFLRGHAHAMATVVARELASFAVEQPA